MHRVLLCLFTTVVASPSKQIENEDFLNLARSVTSLDQEVERICNSHDVHLNEMYCLHHYKLEVFLPGFREDAFKVKIMGRVLYVQAMRGRVGFSEMKVLPVNIDTSTAAWTFKQAHLIIIINYHTPLGKTMPYGCRQASSDTVLDVANKKDLNTTFCIDEKKIRYNESIV